ncbi:hypothetical protein OSTOST_02035, partial [Ostertagia ostertagi]
PHKLNHFPPRAIAQTFIPPLEQNSRLKIPDHVNDDYFKRRKRYLARKKGIFPLPVKVTERRNTNQKAIDAPICNAIKETLNTNHSSVNLRSWLMLNKRQCPQHDVVILLFTINCLL